MIGDTEWRNVRQTAKDECLPRLSCDDCDTDEVKFGGIKIATDEHVTEAARCAVVAPGSKIGLRFVKLDAEHDRARKVLLNSEPGCASYVDA